MYRLPYAQTPQSLCCWHTQSREVDESLAMLDMSTWALISGIYVPKSCVLTRLVYFMCPNQPLKVLRSFNFAPK